MASVNKVILVGNLGADPELKYIPSGDALASIRLATTDKFKDKQSGEMKELTEWHRVTFFGRLAEIVGEYLKKGACVYIEGALKTRKYQAQDGTDRYSTEIVAREMQMLGGGKRGDGESDGGGYSRERNTNAGNGSQRQPQERTGPKAGSAGQSRHQGGGPSGGFDDELDDIPFSPPYRGFQLLCCV